jgi:hypothetical protein
MLQLILQLILIKEVLGRKTYWTVPATYADVEAKDYPVFLLREPAMLDVWSEVIQPPEAAALAAPLQTCKNSDTAHLISFFCYC